MARGSAKKKRDTESCPVSELSDDLLVEIISRVPYKSTRCCKCVCKRWRDLVSHPDHRKKLPRSTLADFFYKTYNERRCSYVSYRYQSVSGNWCPRLDGTLSFLPDRERLDAYLLDSCNGLLLLRRWEREWGIEPKVLDYMVCNPVTETWVTVPATRWSEEVPDARLGFDPAVSSYFHVFEFVHVRWEAGHRERIKSAGVYSSEAGVWTHRSAWDQPIAFDSSSRSAFLDGVLYLSSYDDFGIAFVDVKGNCRVIPAPTAHYEGVAPDLYLSRGQVYLARYDYGASELSIWALEGSSSGNWTLKHNVSHLQLFGKEYSSYAWKYNVIIHPEHDVIFILCTSSFTSHRHSVTKLMSYKMDSGELHFICDIGRGCTTPYLQYVPSFVESLTDGRGCTTPYDLYWVIG